MTGFDQAGVVALLGETSGAPPAAVQAIQTFGLRALLRNDPATVHQVSIESGLSIEDLMAGIEGLTKCGRIETNGEIGRAHV